jgi:hypothetical protein
MNILSKLNLTSGLRPLRPRFDAIGLALALLCAAGASSPAPALAASPGTGQLFASTADDAKQKLSDAGKTAMNKIEELWRKIDEQRLSHRTRDEIVAWVIMGLLVGGVLHMTAKLRRPATVVFGLAGAFLGGIVAHVTQLNLGLGPVLIRYEDLLLSLGGGLLLVLVMRMFMKRKQPKEKEAKE